jgi:hypothetical protein
VLALHLIKLLTLLHSLSSWTHQLLRFVSFFGLRVAGFVPVRHGISFLTTSIVAHARLMRESGLFFIGKRLRQGSNAFAE